MVHNYYKFNAEIERPGYRSLKIKSKDSLTASNKQIFKEKYNEINNNMCKQNESKLARISKFQWFMVCLIFLVRSHTSSKPTMNKNCKRPV